MQSGICSEPSMSRVRHEPVSVLQAFFAVMYVSLTPEIAGYIRLCNYIPHDRNISGERTH